MELNKMGAGVLYMDGKKVCNAKSVTLPSIKFDSKAPCSLNLPINGTIEVDVTTDVASNLMRQYIKYKRKRLINACNNNWRRRHGLPLIRKGTNFYYIKRVVKEAVRNGYYG